MPTSPLQPGRLFSPDEREILLRRFESNIFCKERPPFKLNHVMEAVLDYKTWLFLLMGASIYVSDTRMFEGYPFSSSRRSVMDLSRRSERESSVALDITRCRVLLS